MANLDNKTALMIDDMTGVGCAIAEAFLAEGARAAITGQNVERLDQAADNSGAGVRVRRIDQMDLVQIERVADQIGDTFESLDIAFLNTGQCGLHPLRPSQRISSTTSIEPI